MMMISASQVSKVVYLHAADILFAAEHIQHLRRSVDRKHALRLILVSK